MRPKSLYLSSVRQHDSCCYDCSRKTSSTVSSTTVARKERGFFVSGSHHSESTAAVDNRAIAICQSAVVHSVTMQFQCNHHTTITTTITIAFWWSKVSTGAHHQSIFHQCRPITQIIATKRHRRRRWQEVQQSITPPPLLLVPSTKISFTLSPLWSYF